MAVVVVGMPLGVPVGAGGGGNALENTGGMALCSQREYTTGDSGGARAARTERDPFADPQVDPHADPHGDLEPAGGLR